MDSGTDKNALSRNRDESDNRIVKQGNLFENPPLENLTPEQQGQLIQKIAEIKIDHDAAEKQAELKYETSGQEMRKTGDLVKALEQTNVNFTVNADFETASGKTNVQVKRGCFGLVIAGIAGITGIVLLMLFNVA